MSNDHVDPSGNTEQFKAFAQAPPDRAARSRTPLIIGAAIAVALVALVAFLVLG
jgi:hypothetical protein